MTDLPEEPSVLRLVPQPERATHQRQAQLVTELEHLLVDARAGHLAEYCLLVRDVHSPQIRIRASDTPDLPATTDLLGMLELAQHFLVRRVLFTPPQT